MRRLLSLLFLALGVGGHVQGGHALAVRKIDLRLVVHQQDHDIQVIVVGSPHERGIPAIGESKRFSERWRTLPDRSIATLIACAERSGAAFATV